MLPNITLQRSSVLALLARWPLSVSVRHMKVEDIWPRRMMETLGNPRSRKSLVGIGIEPFVVLALALALNLVVFVRVVEAQQSAEPPRIAVMFSSSPLMEMLGAQPSHPHMRAILDGLRGFGYIDGQNIVIERRSLEGRHERAPEAFADLLKLKVQVIITHDRVARLARRAATTVPIVIIDASDEGEEPLVASLARPGGNVTGLGGAGAADFAGKWLELLKEMVPRISRVTVLTDGFRPQAAAREVQALRTVAPTRRLSLSWAAVKSVEEVMKSLEEAAGQHPQALLVIGGPTLFTASRQIVAFALQRRLPLMAAYPEFVEEGALMSYSADLRDRYRRAATYVDKILKGAKPADLPVERSEKYELVINATTAKAIGLSIPPSLLVRADRVIE